MECLENFDGGLPQTFLMELLELPSLQLKRNISVTRAPPVFNIYGLESGTTYQVGNNFFFFFNSLFILIFPPISLFGGTEEEEDKIKKFFRKSMFTEDSDKWPSAKAHITYFLWINFLLVKWNFSKKPKIKFELVIPPPNSLSSFLAPPLQFFLFLFLLSLKVSVGVLYFCFFHFYLHFLLLYFFFFISLPFFFFFSFKSFNIFTVEIFICQTPN